MFIPFTLLQNQRNILLTTVDGKDYDNLVTATGAEWKRRRNVLSPAFSAHKMKLVCVPDIVIILFLKISDTVYCALWALV